MFADSAVVIVTGGRGGNVIFMADENLNTLGHLRYKHELRAEDGQPGTERRKHGRSASDLIVRVPVGTTVYHNEEEIVDLTANGQQAIIAKGGDGGFGNAHFKSSTRQTPRVAEMGEKGDTFEAQLELKLLADVGLIGFPNAGKSTFLSVVSNARPEIADYAFTTLTPNLGVADIDDESLLIADIPGLIEGAAEGKGLGDAFLKHVERTAVLLHLVDAYTENPAEAYKTIRSELERYSPELINRREVVAITKTEGLDADMVQHQLSELQTIVPSETPLFAISSAAHQGITEVLRELVSQVRDARAEAVPEIVDDPDATPVIRLSGKQEDDAWHVIRQEDHFIVTGTKIEKFAARTDYDNPHSINRLRDIMRKLGVSHELERQGAQGADIIVIGEVGEYRLSFQEQ